MGHGLQVGDFVVEPQLNRIRGAEKTVPVESKALEVLVYLADHPKEVLSKEKIIRAVWGDTFVSDDVLTHAISELRKAFGDDPRNPRFIQTIPRKGYRLIAPVSKPESGSRFAAPERRRRWTPRAALAGAAAVVALSGLYWLSSSSDSPEPAATRFESFPLTSYPGSEGQPTFSPDGSQVAFFWDGPNQDNTDIYIKVLGSETLRRLTFDPAIEADPAWSPDGRRIAFLREKAGDTTEVCLISPNGGPQEVLATVFTRPHLGLAWSPDGRALAVPHRSAVGEPLGIYLLDVESGKKRRLTSSPPGTFLGHTRPAFSPTGRTVAYMEGGRVFLVPAAGGEPRELLTTTTPEGRAGLAWISSQEILFNAPLSFRGRVSESTPFLWRISITGGRAQRLVDTEWAREVVVSRRGNRLAYVKELSDWDIWRIDRQDESKPQTRFISSTKFDGNPQFSPDGRQIVFTSARSGNNEIWRADGDGSNLLQLTSLGRVGAVGSPRWSPDGKKVAFDHWIVEKTLPGVYVVSSSGGPVRRITLDPDPAGDFVGAKELPPFDLVPSWSRDGKWIYFSSNRSGEWQVWKAPAAGEQGDNARQITQQGGYGPALESFDGAYLYYSKRFSSKSDPHNAIWRIPVGGGEEQPVIDSLNSSYTNWGVAADGIYFVNQAPSSGVWAVHFLRFDDDGVTQVSRLAHPPNRLGAAFDVSPDGRWILSAQMESGSDLVLLENFR